MSRIENLGDYNTDRVMLQEKNGYLNALINEFKEIGSLEALPKHIKTEILIGASIGGADVFAAIKVSNYIKRRGVLSINQYKDVLVEDLISQYA